MKSTNGFENANNLNPETHVHDTEDKEDICSTHDFNGYFLSFRKKIEKDIQNSTSNNKDELRLLEDKADKIFEDTLEKIGEQMGSNRGGWYKDSTTEEKFYAKFYEDFNRSIVEYIANAIYEKLNINSVKSKFKLIDGQKVIVSEEIPGSKGVYREDIKNNDDIRSGFVADAYLANWDVIGGIFDNIVKDKDGKMYRVDNGGSLVFRARGGKKDYNPDDIPELKSMLNPAYTSGQVFEGITEEEMREQAKSLLQNLSEEDIDKIIESSGSSGETVETIRAGLKGRLNYLIRRFNIKSSEIQKTLDDSEITKDKHTRKEKTNNNIKEILDTDPSIDAIFDNPEIRSYMSVVYEMQESGGKELKPGHKLEFVIPQEFQDRVVRDVILRHRKAEKYRKDIESSGWDPYGAYSRVELHDLNNNKWRQWIDPKGYNADKFAEHRSAGNPEEEVLHDWVATVGKIKTDLIRLTNVGEHKEYSTSQIHGVEIVFFPDSTDFESKEEIYCKGTKFIDIDKGDTMPSYGGGSFTEGKYIGAIALNQRAGALYELGADPGNSATLRDGKLFIKLEPGKSLAQLEVAIGDTEHLKDISPKTGRHTRLGYAKLWAGIKRAKSGNTEWFMENINVPPQGVFAGGPLLEKSTIEEGDELIIESRADTAYLMGWKIAYKDKK